LNGSSTVLGAILVREGLTSKTALKNLSASARRICQKRSPAKGTGHASIRCGAIYAENAKKQWVVCDLVNRISLITEAVQAFVAPSVG
jgi:hypothetical protein